MKNRLRELVQLHFIKKNGQRRYRYLVLGDRSYFVKKTALILPKCSLKLISSTCWSISLTAYLLCLVDVHTYGYKLCSSSRRLNLYEADFIQGLLMKNVKKLARSFNFTFRNIYDVLSLNNFRLGDFIDRIYPIELEK